MSFHGPPSMNGRGAIHFELWYSSQNTYVAKEILGADIRNMVIEKQK